jgi:hypothetical protein
MTVFAEESLTVTSATPVQLTKSKFDVLGGAKAIKAVVVVKTNPIFYGFITTPTALNGYKAATDSVFEIDGYDNIKNFRCVAQSTTGAIYVNYLF